MKKQFFAAATLLAFGAHAQISGPNRPGPGTSPGTFQAPTTAPIQPPMPADTITTAPRPFTTAPQPSITSPQPGSSITTPRTTIDSPNATAGAVDPFQSTSPTLRDSINSSREWEQRRRLSGPRDLVAPLEPLNGTSTNGLRSGTTSDLNTTGVNTPAAFPEQPLDRSLSAKIRSELSMTPRSLGTLPRTGSTAVNVSPETVRDLRITSHNGRVVLEGRVKSEAERMFIEQQARRVNGVANIENRLTVAEQAVGAPGSSESGQSQSSDLGGQTPQNSSDLNEQNINLTPDF